MSESLSESAGLIRDNYASIEKFSQDVKSAAEEMSSFNRSVMDDMESLVEQVDKTVYSVNNLASIMRESAEINSETIKNVKTAFAESFVEVNKEITGMAQKTGEVFTKILSDSTIGISEKLEKSITDAMVTLDGVVRQFDENQKILAETISALPEQTMTYNRAFTGQINRKLDALKDEISK
jgi:hypothetical protein